MSSLRLALKLSMAEIRPSDEKAVKKIKETSLESASLDDILIVSRKRKASFERQNKLHLNKIDRSNSPTNISENDKSSEYLSIRGDTISIHSDNKHQVIKETHLDNNLTEDNDNHNEDDEDDNNDEVLQKEDDISLEDSIDQGTLLQNIYENIPNDNNMDNNEVSEENNELINTDNTMELENHVIESNNENNQTIQIKKRKKRIPSILKSLESIHAGDVSELLFASATTSNYPNDLDDLDTPRYQSHRAAAMIAKTKLSIKSGRSGSTEDLLITVDDSNHNNITDKNNINSGIKRRKREDLIPMKVNWVQCDHCSKWRSVDPSVSEESLPEKWFCYMNTWDELHNSCKFLEEDEKDAIKKYTIVNNKLMNNDHNHDNHHEEVIPVVVRVKPVPRVGGGRWPKKEIILLEGNTTSVGGGRWPKKEIILLEGNTTTSTTGENNEVVNEHSNGISAKRKSATSRNLGVDNNNIQNSSSAAAISSEVNWVQCNKCRKWRKVPESIDIDSLPDKWFCSLNTWAPAYAKCLSKQEVEDTSPQPITINTDRVLGGGGRKSGSSNSYHNATNNFDGSVKNVSWVQCERKNCKKWRKVPAHINIDSLPEKWFCEMNTWDYDLASCDAPEASDSDGDLQSNAAAIARTQLILANSKGAGTLSYRRIMFGTDGRIRVVFSDKNKNGYGIFSHSETHKPSLNEIYHYSDDYSTTTANGVPLRRVNYWWSSLYDSDLKNDLKYPLQQQQQGTSASLSSMNKILSKTKQTSFSNHIVNNITNGISEITIKNNQEPTTATYLLDTARRIKKLEVQPLKYTWPKKISKSWKILSTIKLFHRLEIEDSIVMSSFLIVPTMQLQINKLYSLITNCSFPNDEYEACREYINIDNLKTIIKRLEDRNLVQVSLSNSGQHLIIEVLQPLNQLSQQYSTKNTISIANATGIHPAWTKQGLPIKLRKFYNNSKYKYEFAETNSITNINQSLDKNSNSTTTTDSDIPIIDNDNSYPSNNINNNNNNNNINNYNNNNNNNNNNNDNNSNDDSSSIINNNNTTTNNNNLTTIKIEEEIVKIKHLYDSSIDDCVTTTHINNEANNEKDANNNKSIVNNSAINNQMIKPFRLQHKQFHTDDNIN